MEGDREDKEEDTEREAGRREREERIKNGGEKKKRWKGGKREGHDLKDQA